jgi:hypothetical protein
MIDSIGTKGHQDIGRRFSQTARTRRRRCSLYYRRLQARRANHIANPGLGLPKTRKDRFAAFAQAADSMEWPGRSLYRPVFRGALPHLLVCLDHTWTIVMDDKARARSAARSNGRHQAIEERHEAANEANVGATTDDSRSTSSECIAARLAVQ